MDVVVFFNGLGNQMSQYSFFLQKKTLNKSTHFISFSHHHNGMELDKLFNINLKTSLLQKALYILFRILLTDRLIIRPLSWAFKLINCKIIAEGYDYSFKRQYLMPSKGITFYYGGWHTEEYFSAIKDIIKSQFTFKTPDDPENVRYISEIRSGNSVSIHVRRGDYLNDANINLFGDVCNRSYFEQAINLIKTKISEPHFFIFSNDFSWVKANLQTDNVTYITANTDLNSWKDMYLMSICKHNIISNSTFSWWGAWLNNNSDKMVIAPSRFLKGDKSSDVYPEQWTKLSDY
jgi:hypothetical protein